MKDVEEEEEERKARRKRGREKKKEEEEEGQVQARGKTSVSADMAHTHGLVCVCVCVAHSELCSVRGRCSTVGYSRSAAASSPCSQLMITTATEDHHLEWGSQPEEEVEQEEKERISREVSFFFKRIHQVNTTKCTGCGGRRELEETRYKGVVLQSAGRKLPL